MVSPSSEALAFDHREKKHLVKRGEDMGKTIPSDKIDIIILNFINFIDFILESNYIRNYFKNILHKVMLCVQLFYAIDIQILHYMRGKSNHGRFIPRLCIFLALFLFFSMSAQALEISGTVFNDLDGDGTRDGGEMGISNWMVCLNDVQDATTHITLTNGAGEYSFTGLTAGSYSVSEVQQDGWTRTMPYADSYPVTLTTTSLAGKDFGNHQTSGYLSISGTKFNDLDGDGTKDAGELGLSGWSIKLMNLDTSTAIGATTDDTGAYSFTGLTAGSYSVSEVQQDGWTRTKPSADSYSVTLTTTSFAGKDFGNHQSSIGPKISGTVFYDMNGDGQKGSTEPGLSGCTVNLAGAATRTTVSGSDGSYSFSSLSAGQYTVTQVPQSGWLQSSPSGSYSVNLGSTSIDNRDFGNRGSYSLSGSVFYDPDGDGTNNGAMGMPGWTIHLTLTGVSTSGLSALAAEESVGTAASYSLEGETSTTTDSQGHYYFDGLVSGSYTISQDQPDVGWVQTCPKSVVYQINLQGNMENVNFGDLQGNSALVVTKKASSSTAHRSEFEFTRNDSSRHDF